MGSEPEIVSVLQWIGTTLEKLNDVNMQILANQDGDAAELLDYAHNTRNVFMADLTEEQLAELNQDFLKWKEERSA